MRKHTGIHRYSSVFILCGILYYSFTGCIPIKELLIIIPFADLYTSLFVAIIPR